MNTQIQEVTHVGIDELAAMVKRGFDEAGNNLKNEVGAVSKRLDARIDNLEQKIEKGFRGLHARFDYAGLNQVTYREHALLKDRVEKVEKQLV